MIIHSPQPWKEVNQSTDRHEAGNLAAYQALEDAYHAGKLRAELVGKRYAVAWITQRFAQPSIRFWLTSRTRHLN